MTAKGLLGFRQGRVWRWWQAVGVGVAFVLMVGVLLVSGDCSGEAPRPGVTSVGEGDVPNAKIIDKDQRVEVEVETPPRW
ncbi:hypothetical protein [Sphaerisporangium sp. TRM90804]|uniref:hypothetical protein n=1 Tax=Sphaerisporangium sp. TRM90804 TaxID=3031113 RepID=UPI00244A8DCA|nr:hypothetical protein [Sphaerisporangium sp. TRM90804]MDH2430906.1 hypothetical protein [Sphaerisporangium sp. TRM90804]